MKNLVFLLEEPSAKDLLIGLLPKLIPENVDVRYVVFEGKQDLEKGLIRKLRRWRLPDSAFVVLRDQDAGDCHEVKSRLAKLAEESERDPVVVRVACRELESWAVGDWEAVGAAFEMPHLKEQAGKAVYRNPDILVRPVEMLRKFVPEYQKRDGARRIGPLLQVDRNHSPSFRAFCAGVMKLVAPEVC